MINTRLQKLVDALNLNLLHDEMEIMGGINELILHCSQYFPEGEARARAKVDDAFKRHEEAREKYEQEHPQPKETHNERTDFNNGYEERREYEDGHQEREFHFNQPEQPAPEPPAADGVFLTFHQLRELLNNPPDDLLRTLNLYEKKQNQKLAERVKYTIEHMK
jgi:hypothetical protein